MVKKKTSEQEEDKHKKQNESSDIKDNTNQKEDNNNTQAGKESNRNGVTQDKSPDKNDSGSNGYIEKLAEMQDKYLRLSAEFDNYRKRTLREKMELSKYASENIIIGLLPFMDDFERALANMNASTDPSAIKEGIDLIYSKFVDFFKQSCVKEIEALNCSFNVDIHDAVAKVPVEEAEKKGKVVDVIQKGYYLQDKVIRHSKVVVGE